MESKSDVRESSNVFNVQDLLDASKELYFATSEWLSKGNKLEAEERAPVAIAFEAAMAAIEYGVPCPEWAAMPVKIAWEKFNDFKCASISEAFEIPDHRQMAAKRDRLKCAAVYHRVRQLQSGGTRLKDNAHGKGALSQVGEEFHMSGKKVEALMKEWKDLCKQTGSNPDVSISGLGDARLAVSEALARGLSSFKTDS